MRQLNQIVIIHHLVNSCTHLITELAEEGLLPRMNPFVLFMFIVRRAFLETKKELLII